MIPTTLEADISAVLDFPCDIVINEIHKDTFTTDNGEVFENLPPFTRMRLELKPAKKSFIRVELWLPDNWNGRFLGTGNGGYAGGLCYWDLAYGIREGFAVANTDMGTYPDVYNGCGNAEMWKDFGYRATHLMTTVSKLIINEFYGEDSKYSYFVGNSTGGQQALSEAQRYPEDYDGIVAGVPANNRTNLHAFFLWNYQALHGIHFTEEEVNVITETAVKAFVENGGNGGDTALIPDPRKPADFGEVICDSLPDSFTEAQKEALLKLYHGPVNPNTGERIYTPLPYGSENQGGGMLSAQSLPDYEGFLYMFKWLFGRDYDYMNFDFDKDMELYHNTFAKYLDANNPDLTPFKNKGGKMIMYSGSSDPIVPYQDAVSYYENAVAKMGGDDNVTDFFKYYIIPGMNHGDGGPGADRPPKWLCNGRYKDVLHGLMNWVENNVEIEELYGVKYNNGNIVSSRKVLPYHKLSVRDNVPKIADRYMK